jgi:hypothetical protein
MATAPPEGTLITLVGVPGWPELQYQVDDGMLAYQFYTMFQEDTGLDLRMFRLTAHGTPWSGGRTAGQLPAQGGHVWLRAAAIVRGGLTQPTEPERATGEGGEQPGNGSQEPRVELSPTAPFSLTGGGSQRPGITERDETRRARRQSPAPNLGPSDQMQQLQGWIDGLSTTLRGFRESVERRLDEQQLARTKVLREVKADTAAVGEAVATLKQENVEVRGQVTELQTKLEEVVEGFARDLREVRGRLDGQQHGGQQEEQAPGNLSGPDARDVTMADPWGPRPDLRLMAAIVALLKAVTVRADATEGEELAGAPSAARGWEVVVVVAALGAVLGCCAGAGAVLAAWALGARRRPAASAQSPPVLRQAEDTEPQRAAVGADAPPAAQQPCGACGARTLRRRNRVTGEWFVGCSAFPRCRATRPLEHEGGHVGNVRCEKWVQTAVTWVRSEGPEQALRQGAGGPRSP